MCILIAIVIAVLFAFITRGEGFDDEFGGYG